MITKCPHLEAVGQQCRPGVPKVGPKRQSWTPKLYFGAPRDALALIISKSTLFRLSAKCKSGLFAFALLISRLNTTTLTSKIVGDKFTYRC